MNWRAVWAIARKDIVDAVKNAYLLIGLVMPVALSLLFRLIFPSQESLSTLTVAVYDPGASHLVAGLQEISSVQVKIVSVDSPEALPEAVKKNVVGGLLVPVGFDAAVAAGQQPELQVYLNRGSGGGALDAFQRMVERQAWALVGRAFPVRMVLTEVAANGTHNLADFNMNQYLLSMLMVMSLAMTGAFVVPTLMVEEKERHTLEALLVSPAGAPEVALGKAIVGMVYSGLGAGVLLVLNKGFQGVWPLTVLAVLLGALFTVLLGLLMGSLFRTTTEVNTWSGIVLLAMIMPSWSSVLPMPRPLDVLNRAIPTYYLVRSLEAAQAGGAAIAGAWGNLAVLAACAVLAFVGVVWRLRQEQR
jgi:ABC-2 type transport system permease protein